MLSKYPLIDILNYMLWVMLSTRLTRPPLIPTRYHLSIYYVSFDGLECTSSTNNILEMPASEDILEGEPPVIDPYEVLGVERTATPDKVKAAYRKAALKHHPGELGIPLDLTYLSYNGIILTELIEFRQGLR